MVPGDPDQRASEDVGCPAGDLPLCMYNAPADGTWTELALGKRACTLLFTLWPAGLFTRYRWP